MFTIKKAKVLVNLKKITILNRKTEEYVDIIPAYGGNIIELVLCKGGNLYSVIDGEKSYEELIKNSCHRSAKLFPFPNRIKDGKYSINGMNYMFPVNHEEENNAIHGFIFDKSFEVSKLEETEMAATLVLEYHYNNNIKGYPFSFKMTITYILSLSGIEVITNVINKGSNTMPMGDGWHPYITLDESIDKLFLQIPSDKRIVVDDRMIPTGDIEIDKRLIILRLLKCMFDDSYYIDNDKTAITKLYSEQKDLTINLWQDSRYSKYKYLQIYIPPSRKSIAIEPMTCKADAFNSGDGLIVLSPNEKFKGEYGVFLS